MSSMSGRSRPSHQRLLPIASAATRRPRPHPVRSDVLRREPLWLPSSSALRRLSFRPSSRNRGCPRAPARPPPPRLRPRRPDRRVLELPTSPHLRRAFDRLRGGPDAGRGARRDVAGGRAARLRGTASQRHIASPLFDYAISRFENRPQ